MQLETKHAMWIIDWALQKCDEQISKAQDDILRLERFGSVNERSAQERIVSQRNFLTQYETCRKFLVEAKSKISTKSAEEFAAAMSETLFGKRKGARR